MRVLSGVKRTSSNHSHSKPSNKRSYLSESQSSITHTGSPVNPMTAKALASKLNERNNMLNGSKKGSAQGTVSSNGTVNDIPVPPLICIQTVSATNRFKEGYDSPNRETASMHRGKFSHAKNFSATSDAHCKTFEGKSHKSDTSSKQFNGTNSVHHSKVVSYYLRSLFPGKN